MSPKAILITIAAGLTSAFCVMASFGVGAIAILLLLLAPLPIYIATLSNGTAVGIGSSILAIMVAATAISPQVAIGIGLAFTIPASIIANQANLAQETDNGMEWYPLPKLFFNLCVILCLGVSCLAFLSGFNAQALSLELTTALQTAFENSSRPPPMSKDELQNFVQLVVKVFPFTLGGFWLVVHIMNLNFASSICRASNMMPRPQDDIATTVSLPKISLAIMLVSLLLSIGLSGIMQFITMIIAGTFVMAFTLIGLASLHYKLRSNPAGGLVLTLTYIMIIVTYPLFYLLSIFGILKVINQSKNLTNTPPSAE